MILGWIVVTLIAAACAVTCVCVLDARREHYRAEREEKAKRKESIEKIFKDVEKVLRGTGQDGSTALGLYNLSGISSDKLFQIEKMVYDMELSLRMKLSDVVTGTPGRNLAIAKEALEEIRQKSATVGYDSGDSGIHKLATDALKAIEGASNAEGVRAVS